MMWLELIKNAASLLEALLPFLEKQFLFLPVNPGIREELMRVSMVLAGVAGIGTYRCTKVSTKARKWLWLWGLVFCAIFLLLQIGLGHGMPSPPVLLPFSARALYVLFFLAFGIAVGGVLGLLP